MAQDEVSTSKLAEILGVTAQQVNRLTKEGTLSRTSRGQYALSGSVQAFVKHREQAVKNRLTSNDESYASGMKRRVLAQAQKIEVENKIRAGELVEMKALEPHWNAICGMVRSAVLAIPRKMATVVLRCRTPEEAEQVLKKEVYAILTRLSQADYRPPDVARRAGNGGPRAAV